MPALMQLFRDVAEERLWLGTEPGFDEARYLAGWRKMIAGEWGAAFAAVRGDRLVGYLSTVPHDAYGWVIGMVVDRAERGRGVGRALMDAVFAWARQQGLTEISLLVFTHNAAAIALYEKTGFEEIERYERDVVRQNGEVFDTILMRKRI